MMKFSAFIIISDHQITMEIQITPSNPEMTDHFPPQTISKRKRNQFFNFEMAKITICERKGTLLFNPIPAGGGGQFEPPL